MKGLINSSLPTDNDHGLFAKVGDTGYNIGKAKYTSAISTSIHENHVMFAELTISACLDYTFSRYILIHQLQLRLPLEGWTEERDATGARVSYVTLDTLKYFSLTYRLSVLRFPQSNCLYKFQDFYLMEIMIIRYCSFYIVVSMNDIFPEWFGNLDIHIERVKGIIR